MSEYLDFSQSEIKQALSNSGRHISMDAPLLDGDETSSTMYDLLPNNAMIHPEDSTERESLRKDIRRSMATLSERESDIIELFYGLNGSHPLSLEEIGEQFNLTRERVRQIKEKAIRRMKHTSRSRMLKQYLG